MTKFLTLAMMTVSVASLSACFSPEKLGSTPGTVNPVVTNNFNFTATQGTLADNNAHAAFSTDLNEDPANTRFTAQFTATGELVLVDQTANGGAGQTYTFTQAELQNSFGSLDFMKTFATQIDNRGTVGFGNPGYEAVYVVTPTNTNTNAYALIRLDSDNGRQWLYVGDPTSTPLAGTATYSGGAYLDSGHAAMTMTADFGQAADAVGVTLVNAYDPTDTTLLGGTSISFNADFDNSNNTLTANGKAIAGSTLYDTAHMQGGFFNGGNNAAGLMNLSDSGAVNPDAYGAFSVVKD